MKLVVVKVWVDVEDDNDAATVVSSMMDNALSSGGEVSDYAIDAVEDAQ